MPAPLGNNYAVGNKGGREKVYTKERIEEEARLFEEWMKKEDSIYFKQFALERGYDSSRFSEWSEENDVFAGVLKKAKEWQECKLINLGLFKKTSEGLTKFILAAKHGFVTQQQVINVQANPAEELAKDISNKSKDLVNINVTDE